MFALAFAQEASGQVPQAAASNPLMSMMPIVLIFIIFYVMLIRPQKKQQSEHAKMLEGLAKNDEVVTSGGVHGTIVNVEKQNEVVTLRIDDSTKIKIQKGAISRLKKEKQVA